MFVCASCGGSPAPVEPPPRSKPAPEEPPAPVDDEDASTPRQELAEIQADSAAPEPNAASSAGTGRLDPDIIAQVVKTHTKEFRACYQLVLAGNPNAKARLSVSFIIGDSGKVTTAAIGKPSGIADMDECVARVFYKMQFPIPSDGYVTVSYPFVFTR